MWEMSLWSILKHFVEIIEVLLKNQLIKNVIQTHKLSAIFLVYFKIDYNKIF